LKKQGERDKVGVEEAASRNMKGANENPKG
jgi:hypothetical protein